MKNYRFTVALDVDDVLLPCVGLACEIANKEFKLDPPLTQDEVNNWNLKGTRAEVIRKYFDDPEFFKKQKPYPGAQEFVRRLSKKAEIFITTAIPAEAMGIRVSQIKKFFPQITPENIIPVYRKDVINVDFMLDDGGHNILASNAKYPVLLRRPWNQHLTGLLAVNTYDEFLNLMDCIKETYMDSDIYFAKPTVLALVGPSGSGKTAITTELLKNDRYRKPISATTRPRRLNESENAYHFVSKEEFEKMRADGRFAETTMYANNYYGVELSSISDTLKDGKHCVIPIDISGAFALKMQFRTAIFYVKRDKKMLINTLLKRITSGESTEDDITDRIISLDHEKSNEILCDYVIDNTSSLENSIKEIETMTDR